MKRAVISLFATSDSLSSTTTRMPDTIEFADYLVQRLKQAGVKQVGLAPWE